MPLLAVKLKADLVISLLNFGPVWSPIPHLLFQRNALYFYNDYLNKLRGIQKYFFRLSRILNYYCMKNSAVIITPSKTMEHVIKDYYSKLSNKKFKTLYYAYEFEKEKVTGLKNYKIENYKNCKNIKLLYVSHPNTYKGFENLFNIVALTKEVNNNFKFFLTIEYNDWPEGVAKYLSLIRSLNINDYVEFLGRIPQNETKYLYKYADIFVFPSLCESFGFPLLEALGNNLPILASDIDSNREICGDAALYFELALPSDGKSKLISLFDVE